MITISEPPFKKRFSKSFIRRFKNHFWIPILPAAIIISIILIVLASVDHEVARQIDGIELEQYEISLTASLSDTIVGHNGSIKSRVEVFYSGNSWLFSLKLKDGNDTLANYISLASSPGGWSSLVELNESQMGDLMKQEKFTGTEEFSSDSRLKITSNDGINNSLSWNFSELQQTNSSNSVSLTFNAVHHGYKESFKMSEDWRLYLGFSLFAFIPAALIYRELYH